MPTIEPFAEVDVSRLAAWLQGVPVAEWPGMADMAWHGAMERLTPVADALLACFPGCTRSGLGLFLLEPGQMHPPHRDEQPSDWVTRVHVPIVTNPHATATTDDGTIHMEVGRAYTFNTLETHAVENGGASPRVHLVFDVKRGAE